MLISDRVTHVRGGEEGLLGRFPSSAHSQLNVNCRAPVSLRRGVYGSMRPRGFSI